MIKISHVIWHKPLFIKYFRPNFHLHGKYFSSVVLNGPAVISNNLHCNVTHNPDENGILLKKSFDENNMKKFTKQLLQCSFLSNTSMVSSEINNLLSPQCIEHLDTLQLGDVVLRIHKFGIVFNNLNNKHICWQMLNKVLNTTDLSAVQYTKAITGFTTCGLQWTTLSNEQQTQFLNQFYKYGTQTFSAYEITFLLYNFSKIGINRQHLPMHIQSNIFCSIIWNMEFFTSETRSRLIKTLGVMKFDLSKEPELSIEICKIASKALFFKQSEMRHDPHYCSRVVSVLQGLCGMKLKYAIMPTGLQTSILRLLEKGLLMLDASATANTMQCLGRMELNWHADLSSAIQLAIETAIQTEGVQMVPQLYSQLLLGIANMHSRVEYLHSDTVLSIEKALDVKVRDMDVIALANTIHALGRMSFHWPFLPKTLTRTILSALHKQYPKMIMYEKSLTLAGLVSMGVTYSDLSMNTKFQHSVRDTLDVDRKMEAQTLADIIYALGGLNIHWFDTFEKHNRHHLRRQLTVYMPRMGTPYFIKTLNGLSGMDVPYFDLGDGIKGLLDKELEKRLDRMDDDEFVNTLYWLGKIQTVWSRINIKLQHKLSEHNTQRMCRLTPSQLVTLTEGLALLKFNLHVNESMRDDLSAVLTEKISSFSEEERASLLTSLDILSNDETTPHSSRGSRRKNKLRITEMLTSSDIPSIIKQEVNTSSRSGSSHSTTVDDNNNDIASSAYSATDLSAETQSDTTQSVSHRDYALQPDRMQLQYYLDKQELAHTTRRHRVVVPLSDNINNALQNIPYQERSIVQTRGAIFHSMLYKQFEQLLHTFVKSNMHRESTDKEMNLSEEDLEEMTGYFEDGLSRV